MEQAAQMVDDRAQEWRRRAVQAQNGCEFKARDECCRFADELEELAAAIRSLAPYVQRT